LRRLLLPLLLVIAATFASGASAAAPPTFVVEGRGWGHGVGMSQYGAQGFALRGHGFRRILAHYYRGTELRRHPPRRVRVLIAEDRPTVVVSSKRPFRVSDARGRSWTIPAGGYRVGPKLLVRVPVGRTKAGAPRMQRTALTAPVTFSPGAQPLSLDGAGYRGALVVRRAARGVSVVNHVPLELYVRGVVPWEMPHRWHPEALAVQAVAARSYALATLKAGRSHDLVADTRDQVYGGIRAEKPSTNAAIARTSGLVLTYRGRIALALYSSTSGGRTAWIDDTLPGNPRFPYLRPVKDPHDSLSPYHRWGPMSYRGPELARKLGVPRVETLRVVRNESDRVSRVEVRWKGGRRVFTGREFQRALQLRSAWFTVRSGEPVARGRPTTPAPPVVRATPARAPYTVVLATVPAGARQSANATAARARRAGLPNVRVLRSAGEASMRPGFLVVVSGGYGDAGKARTAAARARGSFPTAYAKRL
jgi:stage II sporulation protein D